jgi:hypothetical protein
LWHHQVGRLDLFNQNSNVSRMRPNQQLTPVQTVFTWYFMATLYRLRAIVGQAILGAVGWISEEWGLRPNLGKPE